MAQIEITDKQIRKDVSTEVEVGGKTQTIPGSLSFNLETGTGSVTIKIKSGALSFDDDEVDYILDSARDALLAGYLHLREMKAEHHRRKQGVADNQLTIESPEARVTSVEADAEPVSDTDADDQPADLKPTAKAKKKTVRTRVKAK